METHYLGKTGIKVSELCLGMMFFEADEAVSRKIMDRYAEAGGNFIDTADVYYKGLSEEFVGRWLKDKRREDFVLTTKVRGQMDKGANDVGLSRKHILAAAEASLKRLQTDYIDVYLIHGWDPGPSMEETMGALNSLVQTGKVRYLGASNIAGWQLQKMIDLSKQRGWEPFTSVQYLYNLLDRVVEYEILPLGQEEGLGFTCWSPLRGGWLSGKYQRGMSKPPEGTRIEIADKWGLSEAWSKYANERTWKVIDELLAVSRESGKTPAQVALNWLLQRQGVTCPIVGAKTLAQLEDNLGSIGWKLAAEQLQRLTTAGDERVPYPYDSVLSAEKGRGR